MMKAKNNTTHCIDMEKKLISESSEHDTNSSVTNDKSTTSLCGKFEQFQGLIYALVSAIFVSMSTTLNKKAELFSGSEQAAGLTRQQILFFTFPFPDVSPFLSRTFVKFS